MDKELKHEALLSFKQTLLQTIEKARAIVKETQDKLDQVEKEIKQNEGIT